MDILREAHKMHYTVHPGETKMYRDLKQNLWWKRMKVDVSKYVAACEVCQRMKAEHKRPAGLLKPLEIPEWKWEHITMDFVVGLPRSPRGRDAIWVVVDRLTKSAHFIPMKTTNFASELVHERSNQASQGAQVHCFRSRLQICIQILGESSPCIVYQALS